MSETKMTYLQPAPVRIWHWLNALGIVTLILTGVQIRFPEFITIFGSYKTAIMLHNTAGVVVSLSFSLWFFYYKLAGKLAKIYVPNQEELKYGLVRQAFYYFFRYFRGDPSPHHATPDNKFNPMQKSAYLAIMFVLMPLVALTGILLMNVAPLRELVLLSGGLKISSLSTSCWPARSPPFSFTHVYLATLGHTPMAHINPCGQDGRNPRSKSKQKQASGTPTKSRKLKHYPGERRMP